jgi:high-affinity Fe2+/Pb2+ permease
MFVIGLRKGVEADLIVGFVAAFLGQQGRQSALRHVWIRVTVAVLICIGVGRRPLHLSRSAAPPTSTADVGGGWKSLS